MKEMNYGDRRQELNTRLLTCWTDARICRPGLDYGVRLRRRLKIKDPLRSIHHEVLGSVLSIQDINI